MAESELTPKFAPFFGMMNDGPGYRTGLMTPKMIFGSLGAAYGTAKAGIGIAGVGTFRSDLIMKAGYTYALLVWRAVADSGG
ncbi:hypothetical protein AJ80_08848 [Polytolypa hystricis UAMH7299]|uniref:Uncharacterized protein n=1 Tax=Polytolypa hystricis (strain UAMH7299) TaxID=1447883 RepID=A0A2B7X0R9_POLH7|nr:hypothetical protein AJ80_08848 [Polytolypa hystricis UAMH7299]